MPLEIYDAVEIDVKMPPVICFVCQWLCKRQKLRWRLNLSWDFQFNLMFPWFRVNIKDKRQLSVLLNYFSGWNISARYILARRYPGVQGLSSSSLSSYDKSLNPQMTSGWRPAAILEFLLDLGTIPELRPFGAFQRLPCTALWIILDSMNHSFSLLIDIFLSILDTSNLILSPWP